MSARQETTPVKVEEHVPIDPRSVAKRLRNDGMNMLLTVRTGRGEEVPERELDNIAAYRWAMDAGRSYSLSAHYDCRDDLLHVTALADNDLI